MFITVLLALLSHITPQLPSAQASPKATDVGWLTGCWELARGTRHIIEHWTRPEGATLLGLSRTVLDGKTTEYEFLLIREGPRGLEYVARPSGQAEAVFTSVRISPSEAVFENPQHDFPTRITYRRPSADALLARVEGTINGKARAIEYPYLRGTCTP